MSNVIQSFSGNKPKTFAKKIYMYEYILGDDNLLDDFVHNYLRMDGLFCMRLIIKNTNDAIGKLVC